jgi:hypothetical protein
MRLEHWWYTIPLRLRSLFRRAKVEDELQEELRFHLEQQVAREIAAGKTPEEARQGALRAMDGMEQRKEECRDARRVDTISNLVQDLRYAGRALRRNPAFTAVAVLTLALGIGANTAIFSVVNAALLRPLPYPRPEQLMLLFEDFGHRPNVVSFANFTDWERESHSFLAMAAGRQASFNLGGTGSFQPERIEGAVFSWQLFKTLGVQPAIGRAFAANDDRLGAARVAIVSYGLWQRRFGESSDILQRRIRLDGIDCAIIGVMPRSFGYPTRGSDVWVPIIPLFGPDLATNRAWHHLYVIARMRDGVTIGRATAEVNGIQQRLLAANSRRITGARRDRFAFARYHYASESHIASGIAGRRRLSAVDRLCQHLESAAGARIAAVARILDPHLPRREPLAADATTAHREPAAGAHRRRRPGCSSPTGSPVRSARAPA